MPRFCLASAVAWIRYTSDSKNVNVIYVFISWNSCQSVQHLRPCSYSVHGQTCSRDHDLSSSFPPLSLLPLISCKHRTHTHRAPNDILWVFFLFGWRSRAHKKVIWGKFIKCPGKMKVFQAWVFLCTFWGSCAFFFGPFPITSPFTLVSHGHFNYGLILWLYQWRSFGND